jgi:SAM-dependent methyltransferase
MLKEHLSQSHNAASRRTETIKRQVAWIHGELLCEHPAEILDLGCGPRLYASRLARLGHQCVGIDYSPASIGYATECARGEQLPCTYMHQDLRLAEYGEGYGLVMLIYGEFNVFRPSDARSILLKANRALGDGGLLLLEPYTFAAVQKIGEQGLVWSSAERGLFSDEPYVSLVENIWNAATHTTTTRYFIVEAASGQVTRYAQTFQAYSNAEYESLLVECGFGDVLFFPSLTGVEDASASDFMAIVARKREG